MPMPSELTAETIKSLLGRLRLRIDEPSHAALNGHTSRHDWELVRELITSQQNCISALEAQVAHLQSPGQMNSIDGIWHQAEHNHRLYSATGSTEEDLRFLTLGLVGEAGELANFVKKRWRDKEPHLEACRKECADVLAYTMMVAQVLGMAAADLISVAEKKQHAFVTKMKARHSAPLVL